MNYYKEYQPRWNKGTDTGVVGPDAYTISERGDPYILKILCLQKLCTKETIDLELENHNKLLEV